MYEVAISLITSVVTSLPESVAVNTSLSYVYKQILGCLLLVICELRMEMRWLWNSKRHLPFGNVSIASFLRIPSLLVLIHECNYSIQFSGPDLLISPDLSTLVLIKYLCADISIHLRQQFSYCSNIYISNSEMSHLIKHINKQTIHL